MMLEVVCLKVFYKLFHSLLIAVVLYQLITAFLQCIYEADPHPMHFILDNPITCATCLSGKNL